MMYTRMRLISILHLTHQFGRACRGQRCQRIRPTQRRQNFIFGGRSWSCRIHYTQCHTWCMQYRQVFEIHPDQGQAWP